jgi:hypothetical protein
MNGNGRIWPFYSHICETKTIAIFFDFNNYLFL